MKLKTRLVGAAAVALAGMMASGAAFAASSNDGVFTITATNSQLTTSVPGAKTFADSNTFAGYTGSVVTPVATITGGSLNIGGSTNPGTGIAGANITNYLSASNGVDETITFNSNQQYFGMLWGSVDTTNTVSLYEGSTLVASYTGAGLEGNAVALEAYPNPGSFVDFAADSSADDFNKIVLSENSTFFETSNYAALSAGIPEPTTWAMMLVGFGGLGAVMRSARRRQTAVAA